MMQPTTAPGACNGQEQTTLQTIEGKFRELLSDFNNVATRLEDIQLRLQGPEPIGCVPEASPPERMGTLGRLEDDFEDYRLLVNRVRATLEKLEKSV